jgi:hypothetical protein
MFTPPSAAEHPVTQQEAEHAAWDLGILATDASADDVQRAFRARVRDAHPDAGGDAGGAPERIAELRAARDTLLRWLEQAPKAGCRECGGSGYVFGRLAVKPCSRCGA